MNKTMIPLLAAAISYYGRLDQPRHLYFNWHDTKEPMMTVGLSAVR
jgi:hypothetical protein